MASLSSAQIEQLQREGYGQTIDKRPRFDIKPGHRADMGEIVRGKASGRLRCSDYQMLFPEEPTGASFFEQQAKQAKPCP